MLIGTIVPYLPTKAVAVQWLPFVVFAALKVRFLGRGVRLVIGRDFENADPPGLYLLSGKRRSRVGGSLENRVRIVSAGAALDYARLWSSPLTYALRESPLLLEPAPVSQGAKILPLAGGVEPSFASIHRPWHGLAPDDWLRGWPPATVSKVRGGYAIRMRLLLSRSYGEAEVVEAKETVWRNGRVVREFRARPDLTARRPWAEAFRRQDLGGN